MASRDCCACGRKAAALAPSSAAPTAAPRPAPSRESSGGLHDTQGIKINADAL